jgi:hypothetical protein
MCIGFPATSSLLDALGIITRGDHWDELFLDMTAPAIVLLRVQYEEGLSLSIPGGTIEPNEVGCYARCQSALSGSGLKVKMRFCPL